MAKQLQLYIDLISQPSRAVFIFCRMNDIDVEIHNINLLEGQHKSPEFKAINPMAQVPAIVDNGFKLSESHAILRYLATTKDGVSHNWYPADPQRRARIDSILDWHHGNLRRSATGIVFNKVLAPKFGLPIDERAIEEAKKTLENSLLNMENIWLEGDNKFLDGAVEPSLADLSLACEIKQLELLDAKEKSELLDKWVKVKRWLGDVEKAMSSHFEEAHEILNEVRAKI